MTPKQAATKNRQRAAEMSPRIKEAMAVSQKEILLQARRWSSGPFKTKWLRAMARKRGAGLYSRRKPAPPADPALINRQTGKLWAGWRGQIGSTKDRVWLKVWVERSVSYAKYMYGTKKMISRPILQKLHKLEDKHFIQRLRRAGFRVLSGR